MSQPNLKIEMHEAVEDYCRNWTGNFDIATTLHEQIDKPSKRDDLFYEFLEYLEK